MTAPDSGETRWSLAALPGPARFLCAAFLAGISLAYAVALLFVFVQSELKPRGIAAQFRGDSGSESSLSELLPSTPFPDEGPSLGGDEAPPGLREEWDARRGGMRFPKPLREMILTTHVHLLSISMLYFLVGALFSASTFPARAKSWVIGAGFAGLFGGYAAMWVTRFGHPAASWAVYAFGVLQALSLVTQILAGFRDLIPFGKGR